MSPATARRPDHQTAPEAHDPSGQGHSVPSPGRKRRGAEGLIVGLAERLGARVATTTVFGAAIERDGVTVVPVATSRFCFGAGGGADPAKHQEGEGGGGLGSVTPAGYIELKDGQSRFVPIVAPVLRLAAIMIIARALVAAAAIARPWGGGAAHQRRRNRGRRRR